MNINMRVICHVTYVREKHRIPTARDIFKDRSTQYLPLLSQSRTRAFNCLEFPKSNFRVNHRTGSILLPGLCKTEFLRRSFLCTLIKSFNLVTQKIISMKKTCTLSNKLI